MSIVQQGPARGRLRRGWLVTGTCLVAAAVLVPVVFVVLAFARMEAGGEVGVPDGPGATIEMRAGHGFDVLTREPSSAVGPCLVSGAVGTERRVDVQPGSLRWTTILDEPESHDGLRGQWYVAGRFDGPVDGPVLVTCQGTPEMALFSDDDVFGGLALAVLGGGLAFLAGLSCLLVGLLWRRPEVAPAPWQGHQRPLAAPPPPPPPSPAPATAAAPVQAAAPQPLLSARTMAPWERPTPDVPAEQPPQPASEWQPRQWSPPVWTPPGSTTPRPTEQDT